MYTQPKAKNGVYFTRDLTESNYNNGKWLLGYYWRASVISKAPYYPVTNFPGLLDYLNSNYPTYIESLGELLKSIDSQKLIKAMEQAASLKKTDYPRPATFSQAIIDNTNYTLSAKVGDTLDAIGESVMDLGKIVFTASVIGIGVYVFVMFSPQIKSFINKAKTA